MGSERLTTGLEPTAMPISATWRAREPWTLGGGEFHVEAEMTRSAVMQAMARMAMSQSTAMRAMPGALDDRRGEIIIYRLG
jgi:hypothetical protein